MSDRSRSADLGHRARRVRQAGRPGRKCSRVGYRGQVVRPVQEDARGIVAPQAGLAHFRLDRYPASPAVARFVDRYWLASWDLRGRPPYTQQVLSHPAVNVVFTAGTALVHGVKSKIDSRTLQEAGWALGIMFRPASFRPFLGQAGLGDHRPGHPAGRAVRPGGRRTEPPPAGHGSWRGHGAPGRRVPGGDRAVRPAAVRGDHRYCRAGRGRALARPGGRARGRGGAERPAGAAPVRRPRRHQRQGADPPVPAVRGRGTGQAATRRGLGGSGRAAQLQRPGASQQGLLRAARHAAAAVRARLPRVMRSPAGRRSPARHAAARRAARAGSRPRPAPAGRPPRCWPPWAAIRWRPAPGGPRARTRH